MKKERRVHWRDQEGQNMRKPQKEMKIWIERKWM